MNSLPENIKLNKNIVHVYYTDLTKAYNCLQRFYKMLSDDEKDRAGKYHFEKDRNNYLVSRGLLRLILSKYLSIKAQEIIFEYNKYGKPYLKNNNLSFNIAHSSSTFIMTVTKEYDIGIDIEFMRDDLEIINMANNFFSEYEIKELLSLDQTNRLEGFYNCWTRKEAFIKAVGKGLSIPLDSFDVELDPEKLVKILDIRFNSYPIEEWQIIDLSLIPNFKCAVAVKNNNVVLETYKLEKVCSGGK